MLCCPGQAACITDSSTGLCCTDNSRQRVLQACAATVPQDERVSGEGAAGHLAQIQQQCPRVRIVAGLHVAFHSPQVHGPPHKVQVVVVLHGVHRLQERICPLHAKDAAQSDLIWLLEKPSRSSLVHLDQDVLMSSATRSSQQCDQLDCSRIR